MSGGSYLSIWLMLRLFGPRVVIIIVDWLTEPYQPSFQVELDGDEICCSSSDLGIV